MMNKYISLKLRFLGLMLFIFTIKSNCNAQQLPVYSQYFINPYLNNPSEAGNHESIMAFVHYRRQWINIPGAPESALITVDGPVKNKNFSLGLSISNDKTNIVGRTSVFASYNYLVKMSEKQSLQLAVSPGFVQNKIYFDKIRADYTNESTILENSDSKTAFDANAGITYKLGNWKSSFSVFQLNQNSFVYENQYDFKDLQFRLIRHYYFNSSYLFQLKNNFEIEPIVNVRSVQGISPQYDVFTLLKWNNTYWTALGYRRNYGLSFSLGGFLVENIAFTYSYDMATGNIALMSGGSHEISIAYCFGQNQKHTPQKSVVSAQTKIVYQNQDEYELYKQENDELKTELLKHRKQLEKNKEEIEKLKSLLEQNKTLLTELIGKYGVNVEDEVPEQSIDDKPDEQFHVIVGAYYTLNDAKFFQKILDRELNLQTSVYQREDGKYFFVYTRKITDKAELSLEIKHLKKLNITDYINGNIWIAR